MTRRTGLRGGRDALGHRNDDLGDNTVRLQVDRAWAEARQAAGKSIIITKVDGDGNVYMQEAECTGTPGTDTLTCVATFTGEAGGFSHFALLAMGQEDVGGPTPTPGPTDPTPTPTEPPRLRRSRRRRRRATCSS